MIRQFVIITLLAISVSKVNFGQSETYTIRKAFFSSDKYDEFSPVWFRNGIVFCSNRNMSLSSRSTSQNRGLFKIYFIDTTSKADWESSKLFSKNLTTILNDGPVTFSRNKDTIYFSRNRDVTNKLGDISGPRNKLGIYSAVYSGGQWIRVRELRINNEWYNVTTPFLSSDGKKLYFASDKPGGFGGSDLYYSAWKDNRWDDPVNLGPVINTKGNESYPFINPSGELYFSSDGHQGYGGKDIFFSLFSDTSWIKPVCLDPPVNSKFDDFGIVTDTLMNQGFFSSNRDKSIDIYHFRTNVPQVLYNSYQRENQYCFAFSDTNALVIDTTKLDYVWNFGDGFNASGEKVSHCYNGAGKFNINLNIVDKKTRKIFFSKLSYNIEILDYTQPYISGPDIAVKGESLQLDGRRSNLPGYKIIKYLWNFGDGSSAPGSNVNHIFKENGEYPVNLELVLKSTKTGRYLKTGVSKRIIVVGDEKQKNALLAGRTKVLTFPEIKRSENAIIKTLFSAEEEFRKDAVFNVEICSSKIKLGKDNRIFRDVPKKYSITEKFMPEDTAFSYVVDQQMTLMATFPAYRELYSLGYKDVRTKIYVLKDAAEKELHNLIKINGAFADSYFDISDRLTSNAFIMLDQIVKLLNKYPSLKLEVAVHSDDEGTPEASLARTQMHSKLLVNYLINRGINTKRLIPTGFGGSKPIAPDFLEKDRKLNRRIDFIITN